MSLPARFGKYQLVRRIGVGGMAEVYEATLLGPGGFSKRLALKLLLPRLQNDSELVSMFMDEAGIAAGLDHPNIVAVFEFGEIQGNYFMAMEYVDGWELTEIEQRCLKLQREVPLRLAAHVVRELCSGLAHIHGHERGIVHRDVTPHNVFVSHLGQVKLGDFGIAKATARHTHTQDGRIKGKLAYLAPEQATGEPVTARTDVYAAGLILFELLTGRRLIHGAGEVEHIARAMNPPRVAPSELRPEAAPLDDVVRRALERHPALRYPTAALMAADLDRFLTVDPVRPEELAAFVLEVTGGERAAASTELLPLPLGAVAEPTRHDTPGAGGHDTPRVRSGRAPSSQTPRLAEGGDQAAAYERTAASLTSPARNRAAVWVGGAVLAASVLALAGGIVWNFRSPGTAVARDSGAATGTSAAARVEAAAPLQRDLGRVATAGPPDLSSPDRASRRRPPGRPHRAVVARELEPPRRPDAGAPRPSSTELARAEKQRLQSALTLELQQARGRGLWPGDDAQFDLALAQTRRALQTGTLAEAQASLSRVHSQVQAFQMTQSLAKRKLQRVEAAVAAASSRLAEAERQRLNRLSQTILNLIINNSLVEASTQMQRALGELAGR